MRGRLAHMLVRLAVRLQSKDDPHEVYLNVSAGSYKGHRFAFLAARTADKHTAVSFPKGDGTSVKGYVAVPEWIATAGGWDVVRPLVDSYEEAPMTPRETETV